MAVLTVHSVLAGGSAKPVGVLSDLAVGISADGSTILYGISREGLAVSAFNLDASSIPLLDWQSLPAGLSPLGSYGLDLVDLGNGPQAVIMATASAGLPSFELGADGSLPGSVSYLADDGLNGEAIAMVSAESGGTQYVYAVGSAGDVVTRYVLGETSNLAGAASNATPLPDGMTGITALQSGVVSEQAFLFAADGVGDRVGVYKVKTNGDLKLMDDMGAADGLGIDAPSALAQVDVGGQTYLIVAARGSSSLSVLHVDENGKLSATDHLVDDLTSRFQNVTALDAVVVGGRAYVTAGGADDGLTLFELLPGGRLRLIESVADQAETSLQNVSAVAMAAAGEGLEIFAGSGTEAGATRVSMALEAGLVLAASGGGTVTGSSGDDLLSDSVGNDTLQGGGGDDVIYGGRGADWLEGGDGADVFVVLPDTQMDRIGDFDPDQDLLDLSHWPMLRSTSQLTITSLSSGALIGFGSLSLRLHTVDDSALSVDQVLNAITGGFLHFDVSWIGAGDETVQGTEGDDTLQGGPGDDTLLGEGGNDHLDGGDGDDDLSGGAGSDILNGGEGEDDLSGDAGNDTLLGGTGNDLLDGGDGNDRLVGEDGDDQLNGGSGRDLVDGGDGADTLRGADGADILIGRGGGDVMEGGAGADTMSGGAGNDHLDGGDNPDVLRGGSGHDTLIGGNGDDLLRAQIGDDVLDGGDGADRLYGDGGSDTLDGGANDDLLYGGAGGDSLKGGGGHDMLAGQSGNDLLKGEGGDDLLFGGWGNDQLEGGGGNDELQGEVGADSLKGNGGDDILKGQGDPDILLGESGNDQLFGGAGGDVLDGGAGDDLLDGGAGYDRFIFSQGQDVIVDFQDNWDSIEVDSSVLPGSMSVAEILDLAEVRSGDLFFDFGNGNTLTVQGVSNSDVLLDDLVVV